MIKDGNVTENAGNCIAFIEVEGYFHYRRHLYRGVRTGFFSGAGVPFAQGCGEIGVVPAFVFGGA